MSAPIKRRYGGRVIVRGNARRLIEGVKAIKLWQQNECRGILIM